MSRPQPGVKSCLQRWNWSKMKHHESRDCVLHSLQALFVLDFLHKTFDSLTFWCNLEIHLAEFLSVQKKATNVEILIHPDRRLPLNTDKWIQDGMKPSELKVCKVCSYFQNTFVSSHLLPGAFTAFHTSVETRSQQTSDDFNDSKHSC